MTYTDYEGSTELGAPIELYEFVQGTQKWHRATGEMDYLKGQDLYTASPLKRDRIKQSNDVFKDGIALTFPRDDEFASQYLGFAPDEPTTVTIFRGHLGDPDEEFVSYWKGRVVGSKATENSIVIECESIFTSIQRPGLRARFELSCRHTLYGRGCNLLRDAFKVPGSVDSVSGVAVSVSEAAAQPDGFFTGGMIVIPGGAARFITAHTGASLTLIRPLEGLFAGLDIELYPGCDHLKSTCKNKFDNLDNFGGFPYIPTRNPMDGSSII